MEESGRKDRALRVDGLTNGRDLGGLERADGTRTPRGVFFRSDNVDRISPAGWEQVYEAGIRTVVDLRQPQEREGDTQERPAWLTTINVDLDGLENTEFWAGYWDNGLVGTALYFLPHLTEMPERAGAAISSIVNAPPGGVLFHCMGGRDRTGMIAMILLSAVNTSSEQIVGDYLETVRLGDLRAASSNRNNVEPLLNELCERHGTTTEGAFRTALAGFDLCSFIEAAGLPESDRAALDTWRGSILETVVSPCGSERPRGT
ncbi:tyrosine-protein phosphatase [Arthrobacter sp. AK01]|uniref:tyrosine-protein phosphatase n=1 Tax=Arthrobacter sp. AK01 TaxID=2894084 RepID=UPI001E63B963|nr:tyrosine-protein phosphatase [Arthrobacter sp. AK01]MCD4852419.1 tyrosine-protein phosphatase [Arthrobacter sp. AK01]